ncbi:MAG: hypothetical protein AB7O88_21015 [Reyranellaceae bacterium]
MTGAIAGHTVKPLPARNELIDEIRRAGSGCPITFGYPELPDGLYLQQDPPEFADFVAFMAKEAPPAELSIDIGVASGGQTKFLRDYYPCARTITVDLGAHNDARHWPRIKQSLNTDHVLEILDDSHAPRVRDSSCPSKER